MDVSDGPWIETFAQSWYDLYDLTMVQCVNIGSRLSGL